MLARKTNDALQAQRLLAPAAIHDGGTCTEAARIGYRDLAEMMQERDIEVDPGTLFHWVGQSINCVGEL